MPCVRTAVMRQPMMRHPARTFLWCSLPGRAAATRGHLQHRRDRTPPQWLPLLREQLTPARVRDWLGHLVRGPVTRYELPGIDAFNFVCEQALDGGGMSSLRNDPLGKGMAQILLEIPVRLPAPPASQP